MLLNYGVGEDFWESLGQQDQSQSILWEISPEYSLEGLMLKLKFQYLATWCEELIRLKQPWCWERLKARGKGDDRGWDGWMVSPTQWTCVWISSRSWRWTGKPGVLQFMGLQRVEHSWATELSVLANHYRLNVYAPQIHVWKPNPQCDGIWRWSLHEVIRSWG